MTKTKHAAPGKGGALLKTTTNGLSDSTTTSAKQLQFHPLAAIFPLMKGEDFDNLVADIKANGLNEVITTHKGMILDGRNRYRACLAAGVEPLTSSYIGTDPLGYVISSSLHRRHLTVEKKRKLIAKLIKATPEKSDRQIANVAKVDHKTVGAARAELEATGEIPQFEKTTGKDGKARKRPAKKKSTRAPREAQLIRKINDATAKGDQAKTEADDHYKAAADNTDRLAEKLREAEIKIVGLEAEIEDLKRENADLRQQLETAQARAVPPNDDGLDIPPCLRRAPKEPVP